MKSNFNESVCYLSVDEMRAINGGIPWGVVKRGLKWLGKSAVATAVEHYTEKALNWIDKHL